MTDDRHDADDDEPVRFLASHGNETGEDRLLAAAAAADNDDNDDDLLSSYTALLQSHGVQAELQSSGPAQTSEYRSAARSRSDEQLMATDAVDSRPVMTSVNVDSQINVVPSDTALAEPHGGQAELETSSAQTSQSDDAYNNSSIVTTSSTDVDVYCRHLVSTATAAESTETTSNTPVQPPEPSAKLQ